MMNSCIRIIAALSLFLGFASTCLAVGSFSDTDKYAWSETSGWLNQTPTGSGVVVYPDHLEGYLWAENIGWIKLGSASSGGNRTYANSTSGDWGVNLTTTSWGMITGKTLSGYGWSETAGWINFAPTGGGVTLASGLLDGWAWGENIGWIHLRNTSPAYGPVLAPAVTLTATVIGSGSVTTNSGDGSLAWTDATGTGNYLRGTILTLSAIPNLGSSFTAWGGDCSGSDPCILAMDTNCSVTASFAAPGLIKIGETTYPTLALAYANENTITGSNLLIQALTFDENIRFDRNISVTLTGGLNSSFQPTSGYSTINGTVTLSGTGTVTVNRIIIQ